MDKLNIFLPITKVDASQRLVYGVATAECEDRAGEICDYASTKPYYERWSNDIQKASDGKSLGNLRAMHGKTAAGKITAISFDDAERVIEICAKVVDEAEWRKVCEGVYTGFSQGGAYVKRWKDADGLVRYTADPSEISLVDLPCLPSATFQMVKADGETQELFFKTSAPIAGDEWEQVWKSTRDGATFKTKAELRKHHEDLDAILKRGARNSKLDQKRIQSAHDALVEAGARCGEANKALHANEFVSSGAIEKLFAERDALQKALVALQPVVAEILERVTRIEGQPTPLPFSGRPRAVSRSQDGGGASASSDEIAKFIEANRDLLMTEAIKLAQRQPLPISSRR